MEREKEMTGACLVGTKLYPISALRLETEPVDVRVFEGEGPVAPESVAPTDAKHFPGIKESKDGEVALTFSLQPSLPVQVSTSSARGQSVFRNADVKIEELERKISELERKISELEGEKSELQEQLEEAKRENQKCAIVQKEELEANPCQVPQHSTSSNELVLRRASSATYYSSTIPLRQQMNRASQEETIKTLRCNRTGDWEISNQDIEIGPKIGSGSFGTVYKGKYHGEVALKKLNVTVPTEFHLQTFKNEVEVLGKTRHANVLLYMGWTVLPELTIITEWCDNSTLYQHLYDRKTHFEMYKLVNITRQTAQGMGYIHARNIVHRDLKSNNIFLQNNYMVKIGDFGLAIIDSSWNGNKKRQLYGTWAWMAPEVLRQEPDAYTPCCDVYSFGVVIYELITGMQPFLPMEWQQFVFNVGGGKLRVVPSSARKEKPKALEQLCVRCCEYKKDDRPLFPQILADLESLADNMPKTKQSNSI